MPLHFAADSMGLSSFKFFTVGYVKLFLFLHEWRSVVSAVQGHPRSLILLPIESVNMTFY